MLPPHQMKIVWPIFVVHRVNETQQMFNLIGNRFCTLVWKYKHSILCLVIFAIEHCQKLTPFQPVLFDDCLFLLMSHSITTTKYFKPFSSLPFPKNTNTVKTSTKVNALISAVKSAIHTCPLWQKAHSSSTRDGELEQCCSYGYCRIPVSVLSMLIHLFTPSPWL